MFQLLNYYFYTDPISKKRLLKVQAYVNPDLCSCSSDRLADEIRSALRQQDANLVVGDWRTILAEDSARYVEVYYKAARVG